VPRAIPPPPAPAASDPPPNHANVAFVAAAPDKPAIAVPVEAEAKAPTAPYAPKRGALNGYAPEANPFCISNELLTELFNSLSSCSVNIFFERYSEFALSLHRFIASTR